MKIPSGEITNFPLLEHIGKQGKPVLMSTGMSELNEVKEAKKVLLQSGLNDSDLIIMHCNTDYPTPYKDVNLNAMLTIEEKLGVKVGYSDHTRGIEVSIAAAAIGAVVIEKHFTLNRNMKGPDHSASLEPNELGHLVKSIRNIENSMGNGIKTPSASEKKYSFHTKINCCKKANKSK